MDRDRKVETEKWRLKGGERDGELRPSGQGEIHRIGEDEEIEKKKRKETRGSGYLVGMVGKSKSSDRWMSPIENSLASLLFVLLFGCCN